MSFVFSSVISDLFVIWFCLLPYISLHVFRCIFIGDPSSGLGAVSSAHPVEKTFKAHLVENTFKKHLVENTFKAHPVDNTFKVHPVENTFKKHSECSNLHQAAILNFVRYHISCQNYCCRIAKLCEHFLNHSRTITGMIWGFSVQWIWPLKLWTGVLKSYLSQMLNISAKFHENHTCSFWDITSVTN